MLFCVCKVLLVCLATGVGHSSVHSSNTRNVICVFALSCNVHAVLHQLSCWGPVFDSWRVRRGGGVTAGGLAHYACSTLTCLMTSTQFQPRGSSPCASGKEEDTAQRGGADVGGVYDSLVLSASLLLACLVSTSFFFGGGCVVVVWTVLPMHSASSGCGSATISSADSFANSSSE